MTRRQTGRRRRGSTGPLAVADPPQADLAEASATEHDDPAVVSPLPGHATRPDLTTPARDTTMLTHKLRDNGSVQDYWDLHLRARSAADQHAAAAQQARVEEEQRATHLSTLQQQAEQLAQQIIAAQHALGEVTARAQQHEADAAMATRRAEDHKDTTERLCRHNNLPHPAGEGNEPPSNMSGPELLDQTGMSPQAVPSGRSA